MATKLQPVRIESRMFRRGYSKAIADVEQRKLPQLPHETTVISMVEAILKAVEENGEVSSETVQFQCGLLTGYLVRTLG